jgi:hypothetical protein
VRARGGRGTVLVGVESAAVEETTAHGATAEEEGRGGGGELGRGTEGGDGGLGSCAEGRTS